MFDPSAYDREQLWEAAHASSGISVHLLAVYSMAVGLNAKKIVDLGIGSTTKMLRLAAQETGGKVYSCDGNVKRFTYLLDRQEENWSLSLCRSEKFLQEIEGPIDFVMHDAAHDYHQVKLDLELLLPKMRTFGLICLHDTQQPDLSHAMLAAIRDAIQDKPVSLVTLPHASGLTILRLEQGEHSAVDLSGARMEDGRPMSEPVAAPMQFVDREYKRAGSGAGHFLYWRLRKMIKGY